MLCLACSISFFFPPRPQPAQRFAFKTFCPCIIFSHFPPFPPSRMPLPYEKMTCWEAGYAFGFVLEISQLLQVSKLTRDWYFLKTQGLGAVLSSTYFAVAMDREVVFRELPTSVAAACFVLRSLIAPDHLNQLKLWHKERITQHFYPSRRSTSSFLELTPGFSQPLLQNRVTQLLHPKSYKVHVDLTLFQFTVPLNLPVGLWASFSLWRLRRPERCQISRALASLKKDPVSREEYDYKQHSGNTIGIETTATALSQQLYTALASPVSYSWFTLM